MRKWIIATSQYSTDLQVTRIYLEKKGPNTAYRLRRGIVTFESVTSVEAALEASPVPLDDAASLTVDRLSTYKGFQ